MKIIKLTMQAFMTYKEQTVIDFENMIDSGLYLISGPTGAGKTTIFDAMTFALYGVASGSARNQLYFRSDFADAKDETYVEMVFELHHQIYTVKRSPTYTRSGYKTAKMANAYLQYNETIIEGIKEVNQKINALIGVDVHQFKQIVMIAQGEFTKLIYASSEEREKVLRHLFHSESLVTFENLLKEETRGYKEQYLLSSQQLSSRFQLLMFSKEFMQLHHDFHPSYIEEATVENQSLYTQLQSKKVQYESLKKQYDQLSQTFYKQQKQNQDLMEYQNIQTKYQELVMQENDMMKCQKDIEKLKIIEQNQTLLYQHQKNKEEIDNNQKQIHESSLQEKQLLKQKKEIEERYSQLPGMKEKRNNIFIYIEEMKQVLQKQQQYQGILLEYQKAQSNHQKLTDEYQNLSQQHIQFSKRMERDQENVDRLPDLQLELQEKEQLVKEMNQRRISIHDLSELYDHLTKVQDSHFELSEKYKKADQHYQECFQLYQHEDENFKRQQAGILASTLNDNEPCPVCGSLHHPHLAKLSTKVLAANELEELYQEVERRKIRKEETYQDTLIQNEQIQGIHTKIALLKKQLHIEEELSKEVFIHLLSDIIKVTKEAEKTYQKRYNEVDYLKKIKRSLEQDQLLFTQQTQKLEKYVENIHQIEKKLTVFKTQLSELENQHVSIHDKLDEELLLQQNELQSIDDEMTSIEKKYHQYQQNLSLMSHQKEMLLQQKENLSMTFQQLKVKYQKFISQFFETEEKMFEYQTQMKMLNEKEKLYQNYLIQKESLSSRLQTLEKLTKDYKLVDLSFQQSQLTSLEEQRDSALKDYNADLHTYEQNEKIIQSLRNDYQKSQDIFDKYTRYQDLSDIASGKNTQRISFERYVLSSFFEYILEYANVELLKMSHGRFELYRKQETKGAKQQGLDLSVLDYETGMMRDIQSLSGGESFKAALSLALGLSSMIQSYAGGIELNTLFIDEGFGTLDNESIDQALSVLLDLKNDNKVIGIISHVDELKERIHTQIVVEKYHNGSRLHIEKE